MGFQHGILNIMLATTASIDLSSWSREIIILDLKETKNINWPSLEELIRLIWKIISSIRSTIQADKDKLFFLKISRKIPKFKDQMAQADLLLITFNYN